MKINKVYLFLVIASSFLPFLYLFISSGVVHTHDALAHLGRIPAYIKALWDMQIPPRWAGDLNYGYGMPLFVFMYPLPYIIASVFWLCTKSIFLAFELSLFLSYLLSGIFFYLWAHIFFKNEKIALFTTMLYQFAPFRLVELNVRGSLGEVYAYTFLPLIMYGIQHITETHKSQQYIQKLKHSATVTSLTINHPIKIMHQQILLQMLLISFATMLLILSHNSLSLVFFCIAVLYAFCFCPTIHLKIKVLVSLFYGLLLSAWYWIPALIERRYTYGDLFMKDLWKEHFPPFWQFLSPNIFHDPKQQTGGITVFIGSFQILIFALVLYIIVRSILLYVANTYKSKKSFTHELWNTQHFRSLIFGIILTAGSFFFMSTYSSFLWERFAFIRQFQFSWRLLGIIVVAVPFLFHFVSASLHIHQIGNYKLKILVFWSMIALIIFSASYFFIPPLGLDTDKTEDYYWNYPLDTTYFGETNVIWSAGAKDAYPVSQIEIIEGTGIIGHIAKRSTRHEFTFESSDGARLVDNTQYYPGWKVFIDNQKTDIQFQDPEFRGLITFMVPKGIHTIQVVFSKSPVRIIGECISLLSIIIAVILLIFNKYYVNFLIRIARHMYSKNTSKQIIQKIALNISSLNNRKELTFSLFLSLGIAVLFFNKTFFHGFIPFPGDSLISDYKPWRTESYLGYNPGTYPNKSQYPDTIRQIYPWKSLVISQMKSGEWPLWNPYNFSGSPLLANFQSASLYPFNIVYFLFDQKIAWTILVIMQPVLSFLFTYWFARTIGLSPLGSILSGIAYAYSQFNNVWLEYNIMGHVTLWLPLCLIAVEKLRKSYSHTWYLIVVFSITASLLAGHPQMFGYLAFYLFIYSCIRLTFSKTIHVYVFPLVISLGICAVQLFPGIELIIHSARSPHSYSDMMNSILLQPWHLVMSIIPDFFGSPVTRNYSLPDTYIGKVLSVGIPTLILATFSLRKRNLHGSLFLTTSLVVLLLITKNPITMIVYAFPIPFINSSSPNLMGFILAFSLSILGGFGIDTIKQVHFRDRIKTLIPFIVIFTSIWTLLFVKKLHLFPFLDTILMPSFRNSLVSTSFFVIFCIILTFSKFWKNYIAETILIILLLLIEQLFFFTKFNPFVPKTLVFPQNSLFTKLSEISGYDRFWSMGSAQIDANLTTQYKLLSPDGYDPLYPKWYGEFIHASKDGKLLQKFSDSTRSDANIIQANAPDNFAENPFRIQILNFLGVKYIIDRVENNNTIKSFPINQFSPVFSYNGWIIYANKSSNNRVFFASGTNSFDSFESFEKDFFDIHNYKTDVFDMKNVTNNDSSNIAYVSINSYSPNVINIQAFSDIERTIILTDTWYPGWTAYIDGKKFPVLRAYHAFKAIPISQGAHSIKLSFEPVSFRYGMVISALSLIILFLYIIKGKQVYNP